MRKIILLSLLVAAVLPSSASAVTLVTADGAVAQPYQGWANLSDVPTVEDVVRVSMSLGSCDTPTVHACIAMGANEMRLDGPRCGMQGPRAWRFCRFAVMHELGHAFDFAMPEWKRARFTALIGVSDTWDQIDAFGGSLRENFADVYAWCAMREEILVGGRIMPDLSRRNYRRACHLIRIPNAA